MTAYVGFLRISETRSLRVRDVTFKKDRTVIKVLAAKRMPQGFEAVTEANSKYIHFVNDYKDMFKLRATDFLFPSALSMRNHPVAASTIQSYLQKIAESFGWSGKFGFNSCKLGATTTAIEAGLDPEEVRKLARWRTYH